MRISVDLDSRETAVQIFAATPAVGDGDATTAAMSLGRDSLYELGSRKCKSPSHWSNISRAVIVHK